MGRRSLAVWRGLTLVAHNQNIPCPPPVGAAWLQSLARGVWQEEVCGPTSPPSKGVRPSKDKVSAQITGGENQAVTAN
jgi:hypothetical protein